MLERAFRGRISTENELSSANTAQKKFVRVRVTNSSIDTWPAGGKYAVKLSYRWRDLAAAVDHSDFSSTRIPIPYDLRGGETTDLVAQVLTPNLPGRYFLDIELLQENDHYIAT